MMTEGLQYSDEALITLTIEGSSDCFEALMKRHLPAIRAQVVVTSGRTLEFEIDDLMQDVQMKVWLNLSSFRFQSAFRTWATRIAINEVLQAFRKHKHRSRCDGMDNLDDFVSSAESPFDACTRKATALRVRRAVAGLPPMYRDVVVVAELRQYSMRDAASFLNTSVPALKSRLFRAKAKLSHSLKCSRFGRLAA